MPALEWGPPEVARPAVRWGTTQRPPGLSAAERAPRQRAGAQTVGERPDSLARRTWGGGRRQGRRRRRLDGDWARRSGGRLRGRKRTTEDGLVLRGTSRRDVERLVGRPDRWKSLLS